MEPLRGFRIPMIERISVVLPAPLRPMRPLNFPGGTCMFTLRRMLTGPIETSRPSMRSTRRLLARWMQWLPDHIAAHVGVVQYDLRLAVGDDAALVEGENAMRVAADDVHIMLDEQHRHALRGERRHHDI